MNEKEHKKTANKKFLVGLGPKELLSTGSSTFSTASGGQKNDQRSLDLCSHKRDWTDDSNNSKVTASGFRGTGHLRVSAAACVESSAVREIACLE
jgi:hypothetical protein